DERVHGSTADPVDVSDLPLRRPHGPPFLGGSLRRLSGAQMALSTRPARPGLDLPALSDYRPGCPGPTGGAGHPGDGDPAPEGRSDELGRPWRLSGVPGWV